MSVVWTSEMRDRYSQMAKARWSDPFYRANHGKSIQKPPSCTHCGETDINKYYVDKDGKRTSSYCKECHKQNGKRRWHSKSLLEKRLVNVGKYGLTTEQYTDLVNKQAGKCAICGEAPKTLRGLHIDHCHSTGKVRGLLCHTCNVGIGALREDPKIFAKALEYLNV